MPCPKFVKMTKTHIFFLLWHDFVAITMSQSMYITSSSPEKQPKNVFVFSIKIQLLKTSNNTSAPLLFCFVFVLILFFTQSFTMRYDGSYHELGEISQITELSEFSKITSFYFKARQRITKCIFFYKQHVILTWVGHMTRHQSVSMGCTQIWGQRSLRGHFRSESKNLQNVSSFTNNMWYWHELVIWLDFSRCLWGVHRFGVKGH